MKIKNHKNMKIKTMNIKYVATKHNKQQNKKKTTKIKKEFKPQKRDK